MLDLQGILEGAHPRTLPRLRRQAVRRQRCRALHRPAMSRWQSRLRAVGGEGDADCMGTYCRGRREQGSRPCAARVIGTSSRTNSGEAPATVDPDGLRGSSVEGTRAAASREPTTVASRVEISDATRDGTVGSAERIQSRPRVVRGCDRGLGRRPHWRRELSHAPRADWEGDRGAGCLVRHGVAGAEQGGLSRKGCERVRRGERGKNTPRSMDTRPERTASRGPQRREARWCKSIRRGERMTATKPSRGGGRLPGIAGCRGARLVQVAAEPACSESSRRWPPECVE